MTRRDTKHEAGFGIIEVIVMLCILIAIAFAGWYIWHESRKSSTSAGGVTNSFDECKQAGNRIQESYPEVCVTEDGKQFPNPAQVAQPKFIGAENQAGQTLLRVGQWGVELPLQESSKDLMYRYEKNGSQETVFFTFKSLQEKNVCKNDVGVRLTRKKTENEPPFNTDNPQSFKKLGTYFYYVAYSDEPCYDANIQEEREVITQIAGTTDIRQFVVDSLKDLRITDN